MEVTMSSIALWLVVAATYFCLLVLICKCMNLGDRKYEKVTLSTNRHRWTRRAVPEKTELPSGVAAKSTDSKVA